MANAEKPGDKELKFEFDPLSDFLILDSLQGEPNVSTSHNPLFDDELPSDSKPRSSSSGSTSGETMAAFFVGGDSRDPLLSFLTEKTDTPAAKPVAFAKL